MLFGTTASTTRKMTGENRNIRLHKRRLRNSVYAARSKMKRQLLLKRNPDEEDELLKESFCLIEEASQKAEEAIELRAKNFMLRKEIELLMADQTL